VAEEGIPCRDISVRLSVREKVSNRVYLASSGEDLPHELSGGALVLSVPELHVHDIVVVECEPQGVATAGASAPAVLRGTPRYQPDRRTTWQQPRTSI